MTDEKKYFSGVIEYDVKFEVLNPDYELMWFYEQRFGTKMKVTIAQNGDYIKEYFNTADYGIEYRAYEVTKNYYYGKSKYMDTLMVIRGDPKDILTLESTTKLPSEMILGNTCQGIRQQCKVDSTVSQIANKIVTIDHYFTNDFHISPKVHQGINDVSWQHFLGVGNGAYYLKMNLEEVNYKITYTATNIERKDITAIDFTPYLKGRPIQYIE